MTQLAAFNVIVVVFFLAGCACQRSTGRVFVQGHDSFAFANELKWDYEFRDSGEVITRKIDPVPEYSLRCFPMVRAAREFFYHAQFAPGLPRLSPDEYRVLTRAVLRRSSRCPSDGQDRIVIPGFRDLHAFSSELGPLLREECGGAWRSFLQRGNWRMVFPVSESQRKQTAERFLNELRVGRLPIAHVYQFPDTTLNHALLLYSATESESLITLRAYDPNDPDRPANLTFDRSTNSFILERTRYFSGGTVQVYEVYRGAVY